MIHDLEERLEQHLSNPSQSDHDPGQLAGIRRLARRRSMRNRVAAGALGLAALAGLGSFVPTNDESNALITATQPTTEPDPTVEQIDEPQTESEFVDPPVFLSIVSDGLGGFVGADKLDQQTVQFLRSDDGENWRLAETWAMPDGIRFETLSFADGLFIAQLEQPEPDTSGDGLFSTPLLAVSTDLQSWDYIEVDIASDRSEPLPGIPEQQVEYRIDSFVRNGDKLAMLVHPAPQFNPQTYDLTYSEICGQIARPTGITLVLCDGDTRELPAGHFARAPLGVQSRVFVAEDGEAATALDVEIPPLNMFENVGSTYGLVAAGDGFQVLAPGDEINDLLPLDIRAEAAAEGLDATFVSAHVGSDGHTLVVAKVGEDLVPLRTAKGDESLDSAAGSFPSAAVLGPVSDMAVIHLGHGPAGWVLALVSLEDQFAIVEQNEWNVSSGAGSPSAALRSITDDETIVFEVNSNALPPNLHVSLFGGVRYLHPETGELLVELSAAEALIPEPWAEIEDQIGVGRSLVEDGWELRGNPVTGPLTLTSPDGDVREFADGFAFDNDDISDGVETNFSNRSFVQGTLYGAGAIAFYDDQGNELVTMQGYKIITEFITPVVDETDHFEALVSDPFPIPPFAVVYSSDGIEWTELPIADELADQDVSSLAVGDDEILTGLIPQELLRTPLGEPSE